MMDSDQDETGQEQASDEDDDFGQRLPPLYLYIKRVLDKYPEGGQIFKELLQNADDAGASEIIFLHDKTQHPTDHLWSQSLQKFNGPALYVYNDATFKDSDWQSIQHPEQSGKHDDPTKVGRFGLGFISVYHITDVPSILSGRYIGFLDPNETYFTKDPYTGVEKGKRGKKWRISQKLLEPGLKDQFSPYLDPIFKCNKETFKNGYYNGTIFRFPLRADENSKFSHTVYDEARVQSLFQSFQRDAEISLLFLKNIVSISMYEKVSPKHPGKLVFNAAISQNDRVALQEERSRFLQSCKASGNQDAIIRSTATVQVESTQVTASPLASTRGGNGYLIVNYLKMEGLSKGMLKLMEDEELKQLPWIGLALKFTPVVAKTGRMFCFLPLPEDECSHLPVHVHGYFGLGDNRRSIKWPDKESEHDMAAQWNVGLVKDVFPHAYVELLTMAIDSNMHHLSVYKLWPDIGNLSGPWEIGVRRLIGKLRELPVIHTEANDGSWQRPNQVIIDIQQDSLIYEVMLKKQRPIVHIPMNVLEALHWGDIKFKEVTPALVREAIRDDPLEWLDRREKIQLLEYILRDKDVADLENIYLLRLQDESFIPFMKEGDIIYVPNKDVPETLFPNMERSLSARDCPELLRSEEAQACTQLQGLTVDMVPGLLKRCLPNEWREGDDLVTWTPGLEGEPQAGWLEELWKWIQKSGISLDSFISLPLIQVSQIAANSGEDLVQLARLQLNRLIYQKNATPQLTDSICDFLESLHITVVKNDLPGFISQHHEIGKFVRPSNGSGVMHILTGKGFPDIDVLTQLDHGPECLRPDLVALLSSSSLTPNWIRFLTTLPLFQTSEGVFERVAECESGLRKDYHGLPIQKVNRRYILLENSTTLAVTLGVKEESLTNLLQSCVLPGVESRYYTPQESLTIIEWVLDRGHLDNLVKSVKFIPTADGSYSIPAELFDPENLLLTALYEGRPVFPTEEYATGRLLNHIRRIGFRQELSISALEVLDIAHEVSQSGDRTRGKALLDFICKYPDILSRQLKTQDGVVLTLGNRLHSIAWVSCETSRPSSYPDCLPWYEIPKKLNSPREVELLIHAVLLGSSMPLVDVAKYNPYLDTYFGWNNDARTIPIEGVLQHLKNLAVSATSSPSVLRMTETIASIYKFLDELPAKNLMKHHFSTGGIMDNVSWVWHGTGFTTPNNVAFCSRISPRTYLKQVPEAFGSYKTLLLDLGVKESFTTDDYIQLLQNLEKFKKGNRITDAELKIAKDIIEAITSDSCSLDIYYERICIPDRNGVLQSIDKVFYNDINDDITETDDLDEVIEVHHSLTSRQAKLLGVRSLREIQLDSCSSDLGFELPFGQCEKLTTRLRGILCEYSHTPDVLKELLQNADDAGATEIHVVYDPRRHQGRSITGDTWKPMHNAPALCVYNDKPFTDADIMGIQNVGVGGKISDATTTGRFGIGFNAVYHLTDCPTFLTQNTSKLCIFDPHVKYVPRATTTNPGKLYRQDGPRGCKVAFPDMIEGYLCSFGEFDLKKGTMFRFPLREDGMESEISDKCYTREDVTKLLTEFEKASKHALMFLNNVQKISISEINLETHELQLRYSVSATIPDQKPRHDLCAELQKYKDGIPTAGSPQMIREYRFHLTESTNRGKVNVSKTEWMVCQAIGSIVPYSFGRQNAEMREFMSKSFIPRGGVAAPVNGQEVSGKAFCSLPLDITTGLPVHVNGTFALDQSRRNLKKGANQEIYTWNQLLAESVIAPSYAHLIEKACRSTQKKSVYKLWPNSIRNLTGVWERLARQLISELSRRPVIYTRVMVGSWRQPNQVIIDAEQDLLIRKVMLKKQLPIAHVPENVLEALRWGDIQFEEVKPALVREAVRGDPLEWLDRKEKVQLLKYILRDGQVSELENIHLLPLEDKSFIPFLREGNAVYVPNVDVPRFLFPNMQRSLSAADCPQLLRSEEAQACSQLQGLTIDMVPALLKRRCLPKEWREGHTTVTWTPGLKGEPQADWLEKLWKWIHKAGISLDKFIPLPLIQINSTTRRPWASVLPWGTERDSFQLARLQPNRLIYQKSGCTKLASSICVFLESLHITVVTNDLPEFMSKNREIGNFIRAANGTGVMQILERVPYNDVITQLTACQERLRPDLVALLSTTSLTDNWTMTLRTLPLFLTSDGSFQSVAVCEKGVRKDYRGIPIQRVNGLYILLNSSTTLAIRLGLKEERLEEFLQSCVLPSVESHFYSQQESLTIMEWVLERGQLDPLVKSLKFIPTSDGSYATPDQMFDPENSLLTALYDGRPVFPTGEYAKGRLLSHLKRIGFRQELSVSAVEVINIAQKVKQSGDRKGGRALLDFICKYPDILSRQVRNQHGMNQYLGSLLKRIAWVPCETSRHSSYPVSLPWYQHPKKLFCPSEVKLFQDAVLLGSAVPLVRVDDYQYHPHLQKYFDWTNDPGTVPVAGVLLHLKTISSTTTSIQDAPKMTETMISIYKFLDEQPDQMNVKRHFCTGGIMENVPWVWHGTGFTTPNKVAFRSSISRGRYLQRLPAEFCKFKRVLLHLGVRESFSTNDYINLLHHFQRSKKEGKLDQRELRIAQDIIAAITSDGSKLDAYRDRIYIPDCNCVMRSINEVIYNDEGDITVGGSFDDFIDVHHSLTSLQARLLGVRNRREIELDRCSSALGFELPFGQREKLTTRLRGIIREYSHTPDVLKELLQNADDAGATELHIVYDPRRHQGKSITGDKWKPMHNAPALCVYNDKPFTDEDIDGIQNIGVGGKISDATATGRFGIGFNAVYHLTDCPTFLTQNTSKLCIFDPHVKYEPRATRSNPGNLYFQDGPRGYKVTFPDMIEGYLSGFNEFNLHNGTMFRFPLREPGTKSEISDKYYTKENVETLLSDFERTSKVALLFLNSVQKISISEIDPETNALQVRYSVTTEISASDKKQRQDVSAELLKYKGDLPDLTSSQLIRTYRLHLTETSLNGRRKTGDEWLVCQSIGFDKAPDITPLHVEMREFMTKSFIPRGGVAVPLNGHLGLGKAFCFLPLQISTDLPVHVNGTFVLDQSRRNLKKGDGSMIHRWNQVLAEHVIAPAYAYLIKKAGRILYKSPNNLLHIDGMWSCNRFESLFPTSLARYSEVWKLVAVSTLKFIGNKNMRVMPVVRSTGDNFNEVQWCSPNQTESNAFFDNLNALDEEDQGKSKMVLHYLPNTQEKKSSILRLFLQRTKFNLISCSGHICSAFQEVGINANHISPETCCHHVQSTERLARSLPCHISETEFQTTDCLKIVFKYCLNGLQQPRGLLSMPFQLDARNILSTFSIPNAKYVSFDNDLLPSKPELFLHVNVISTLYTWLNNDVKWKNAYESGVVKYFGVRALVNHIDNVLPGQWKGSECHVDWQPSLDRHPDEGWLQRLWGFLCKHDTELEYIHDWPIIPTTDSKLVSLKMAKSVLFLGNDYDTVEQIEVSNALQRLGCPVADVSKMTSWKFQESTVHALLKRCLATPRRQTDVLFVLRFTIVEQHTDLTGRITPEECDTLLEYFQAATNLTRDNVNILRHLPLFPVAESQSRSSIHRFQHCYVLRESLTGIPETKFQERMETKGCIFLRYRVGFTRLYDLLGIECVGLIDIYTSFVLPFYHELPHAVGILHIEYIRDILLPDSSKGNRAKLYNQLKNIKFIPNEDGQLHKVSYYFNADNPVFAKMVPSQQLLPHEFCTVEWIDFLVCIGLRNEVTDYLIIAFAEQIETSSQQITTKEQYQNLKTNSLTLLNEFKSNASSYKNQTLHRISTIRFIPSLIIDAERRQIHPQFPPPGKSYQRWFICFRGSVPENHKDLVWSVASLLPTPAVPSSEDIKQRLGIEAEAPVGKVLQHIRNVCCKMAEHNAYDKEDTLAVRTVLIRKLNTMMLFLKHNLRYHRKVIHQRLQDTPICMVDDHTVLVKASQLVFEIPKSTENQLKPYVYKAPWDLGLYAELLIVLGAQKEVTFDQLAMALEGIKEDCKDKEMMSNERQKAHCASRCLFHLLQSTGGQCPISVTRLYLPTSDNKLAVSTTLYYTDLSEAEAKKLPCSPNTEFLVPLKQLMLLDETEANLIQLLPQHLRPKKMPTHEKPLQTNIPCGDSQCPLVIHMQGIINSHETQEILLRLLQHQTNQSPKSQTKERIATLRKFNSFRCVQVLHTGYFNSTGALVVERDMPRDIFLTNTISNATLHLSHTEVPDNPGRAATLFLVLATSINTICRLNLDDLHIQYLSQVLPLPSISKNTFLAHCGIPVYDTPADILATSHDERPGSVVPRDILCFLDDDMSNKFHPGDIAVYKQHHDDGSVSFIYATVLERFPKTGEIAEDSTSLQRKYKIDIGESNPRVVSVVELFMFRRPQEDDEFPEGQSEDVELSSGRELVLLGNASGGGDGGRSSSVGGGSQARGRRGVSGNSGPSSESRGSGTTRKPLPRDFETAKAQIRKDVQEAMKLSETQKKECLRRLYRMWHPDKNPDQVELATKCFQFLKQEIERAKSGSSGSFEHNYNQWNEDISRDREQEQRYHQHFRHFFSTGGQQSFGRSQYFYHSYAGRRRQNRGRSQYFPHSFTNRRPDVRSAMLWYRQATEDLQMAKECRQKGVRTSQAWIALMIQQSAEKALKALIFYLDGSPDPDHSLPRLLAKAFQYLAPTKSDILRELVDQLVQLKCDSTGTRYPKDNCTTGEAYQNFNADLALVFCQSLLSTIHNILSN